MNKTIFVLLVFLLSLDTAYSQQTDTAFSRYSSNQDYEQFMKKRNTYNTVGWVMLGTGVVSALYSFYSWAKDDYNGTWDLEPLFLAGSGVAIASIPVFIVAGSYKRKANLALKGETFLPGIRMAKPAYPAVALQVSF